jgi:alpha-1,2-mannosyltransferase
VNATSGVAARRGGVLFAGRRVAAAFAYALLPAVLLTVMLAGSIHDHFAFDFHQFWQGGRDVIDGHSPYPPADSVPRGGDATLDAQGIQDVYRFPYPAAAALLMVPLGALPFAVAAAVFVLLSAAAVILALRLLGVVDWRCYGVALASMPALGALRLGTFTPLLLLALAVAWRFRNRALVCATATGLAVAVKLFLWPLVVWLVLSRRIASAALAAAIAVVVTVAAWAALGFAGMTAYPALLASLTASVQAKGWSVVSLSVAAGASATAGKLFAAAAAATLLLVAGVLRRDVVSFAFAVAAAIVLSPIVWLHYYLLLAAPVALVSPALSPAWAVLLVFWLSPFQETGGDVWRILLGLTAVASVCAATALRSDRVRTA